MAILKKQPKNDVDALQAQRDTLAARLAAAEKAAHDLDPLNDWERLSALATEAQALERAIATADTRIASARLVERDAHRQQHDAAQQAAAVAARARVDAAARRVCVQVQAFADGELAELRHAQRELGAVGGYPDPSAAVAVRLAGAVDAALDGWRTAAPTWLGLPEPQTAAALVLAERQAVVKIAETRLDDYRKMQRDYKRGDARPSDELLRTFAHGLAAARMQLLALVEPGLDEITLMNKSAGGINELAEWLGSWHEKRIDAERKTQRQDAARAML